MPKGVYIRKTKPIAPSVKVRSIAERFWLKVDKNGPIPKHRPELGQCWLWTGATDGKGYGKLQIGTLKAPKLRIASRLAWLLETGVEANGQVLHHCDVRACVRFSHLFEGTVADNMRDKKQKGRAPHGEDIHQSKLTEDQVLEIRRLHDAGLLRLSGAAKYYGVGMSTIWNVVTRKSWQHLG